jgi:hypothetical protein
MNLIEKLDHYISETSHFCDPLYDAYPKLRAVVIAAKLSVINIKDGTNIGVYRHLGNGDTAIDGQNWHHLNDSIAALEEPVP